MERIERGRVRERAGGANVGEELLARGYAVIEDFMDPDEVSGLLSDIEALWEEGEFEFARIGQGKERQVCPAVRSDRIHWLEPSALTEAQGVYLEQLEGVRRAINQATMLGLFEWEGHFAVYGPGTFYRRHLDVFRHAQERKVSTILYLNQGWTPGDGGELRMYTDGISLESYVDIAPRAGTLVCFLSESFYHEVLPARVDRKSVTGWFRVRS